MKRNQLRLLGEETRKNVYEIANKVAKGEAISDTERALAAVVLRAWALGWKGRVRPGQDTKFDHEEAVLEYKTMIDTNIRKGQAVADLASKYGVSEVSIRAAIAKAKLLE